MHLEIWVGIILLVSDPPSQKTVKLSLKEIGVPRRGFDWGEVAVLRRGKGNEVMAIKKEVFFDTS